MGAASTRPSLRPLFEEGGETSITRTRKAPREGEGALVKMVAIDFRIGLTCSRHCERSEAIQRLNAATLDCFGAKGRLAMTSGDSPDAR